MLPLQATQEVDPDMFQINKLIGNHSHPIEEEYASSKAAGGKTY
jgi:hypothetical protein